MAATPNDSCCRSPATGAGAAPSPLQGKPGQGESRRCLPGHQSPPRCYRPLEPSLPGRTSGAGGRGCRVGSCGSLAKLGGCKGVLGPRASPVPWLGTGPAAPPIPSARIKGRNAKGVGWGVRGNAGTGRRWCIPAMSQARGLRAIRDGGRGRAAPAAAVLNGVSAGPL